MNWLDYAVSGVLVVSLVWSALRGVVREILSLGGWVMAFLAASLFAGPLALELPAAIPGEPLRVLAAYVAIFLAVLIIAGLTGWLLSKLVKVAGLGAADRLLGGLFGLARGVVLVLVLALMAGLTSAPRQAFWRDSVTGEPLAEAALALKPWLPATFAGRLRYD
jgi:membrane protein required for colicin V production